MTRKRKMNGSLLRQILSIVDSTLKLLLNLLKTKISLGYFLITVGVFSLSITIIIIVNSSPSKDLPTPSPPIDVISEVQLKDSNELDSEEPKDTEKGAESGTQRTENSGISEQLTDIRKDVKKGTQHLEEMRESVKNMNEDAEKMIEQLEKMQENLDGGSED